MSRDELKLDADQNWFDLSPNLRRMLAREAVVTYLMTGPQWLTRWEQNDPRTCLPDQSDGSGPYQGRKLAENVFFYRLSIVWSNLASRVNTPGKRKRSMIEEEKKCNDVNCEACGATKVLKCPDGCDDNVHSFAVSSDCRRRYVRDPSKVQYQIPLKTSHLEAVAEKVLFHPIQVQMKRIQLFRMKKTRIICKKSNCRSYLAYIFRAKFLNESAFEHQEVKQTIDFPNPPVDNFYPAGPADQRHFRPSQMHAVAWMISRIEAEGGIVADEIGLGKILPLSYFF